jgi:diguanylate cyclase (GGDEF)-like protein
LCAKPTPRIDTAVKNLQLSSRNRDRGGLICCRKDPNGVAAHDFSAITEDPLNLTISIGAAQYKPGEVMKDLVKRTDDALYAAKQNGKNQVYSSK